MMDSALTERAEVIKFIFILMDVALSWRFIPRTTVSQSEH